MKVLIVGQCFVSEENEEILIPGGTERYVYGLAKQLQAYNHEIVVLSTTQDKNKIGWENIDGISTYRMYIPSKFHLLIEDFLLFFNALNIIKDFKPAVIHAISPFYKFSSGAILAAKIFRKRTVYTRTTQPHEQGRSKYPLFMENRIFIPILKHADITIALSEHMKKKMEAKFPKVEVIPSFIMKNYSKTVEKKPLTILYVGRLDEFKGVDVLIESMRYIKEQLPEVTLHIAGTGEYLNHLTKLTYSYKLKENIIFEGHLNDSELINIYSQSDIFVFPSLIEGMPMVLIEAMSSGLPIIASDIEPCVELLEYGKYGILVQKGDPKALADSIFKLITDDTLKNHYSIMCLEKSKQYTQEVIVKKIENLYNKKTL